MATTTLSAAATTRLTNAGFSQAQINEIQRSNTSTNTLVEKIEKFVVGRGTFTNEIPEGTVWVPGDNRINFGFSRVATAPNALANQPIDEIIRLLSHELGHATGTRQATGATLSYVSPEAFSQARATGEGEAYLSEFQARSERGGIVMSGQTDDLFQRMFREE